TAGWLALLLAGTSGSPAPAQTFGPPIPTELVLVLLNREGSVRFTLATYYTQWENPFKIKETVYSRVLRMPVSSTFRLVASTPTSPLFEGTYVVNRYWSVGFWYNPIRGERLKKDVL